MPTFNEKQCKEQFIDETFAYRDKRKTEKQREIKNWTEVKDRTKSFEDRNTERDRSVLKQMNYNSKKNLFTYVLGRDISTDIGKKTQEG